MTDATNSTPIGASVDQVSAVNALLAQEFQPEPEAPKKKVEEEALEGQTESTTPLEDEGEGSGEAQAQDDEGITWAGALGLDDNQIHLDDDGNLAGLRVKVDGQESVVPVKDLIAGYQTNKHNTQKSQALADERREFEQTRNTVAQDLISRLDVHDRLYQIQQQSLLREFETINWDKLRTENPGEFAIQMREFETRKTNLDNLNQALAAEREQLIQAQRAQYAHHRVEFLNQQYEKALSNNPAWSDPEKLQADIRQMGAFAQEVYGVLPEEFSMLEDARHIEILKDAMAYRKGQALAQEKVATAPKFIKGGKSGKPMDRVTQLTLNARKATGANKINAQAAAVNELLAGL